MYCFDSDKDCGEFLLQCKFAGIKYDSVGGLCKRRRVPAAVNAVACGEILLDVFGRDLLAPFREFSWRRRCARVARSAIRYTFTSASGQTTVPISRPTITTLFSSGQALLHWKQGCARFRLSRNR